MLQPPLSTGALVKDRQVEQCPQFFMLGNQQRHILPGLSPSEPLKQQVIGVPPRRLVVLGRGKRRPLGVGDRLNPSPGKGVERHNPAIFEHRDLPPGSQRVAADALRCRSTDSGDQTDTQNESGDREQLRRGRAHADRGGG